MRVPQRFTAVAVVALVLLLAACATGPRITSEVDPQADFASYRTFAFYSPLALEKEGYATPTSERIKAATRAQMESRGYVYSAEQADLLVNINGNVQERTDVTTMPSMGSRKQPRCRKAWRRNRPNSVRRARRSTARAEWPMDFRPVPRRRRAEPWEGNVSPIQQPVGQALVLASAFRDSGDRP